MRRPLLYTVLFTLSLFVLTSCEKALDLEEPASDPVAVFDEVWKVLDEQYALFPIKTVDWNEAYREFRPRVSSDMTEKQLFDLITEMLASLEDGHVSLVSPSYTYTYLGFYLGFPRNFNYQNVLTNYLRPDHLKIGPLQVRVEDELAYIYYRSFGDDLSEENMTELFNVVSGTKGMIIDVRDNGGGRSANVNRLVQLFITQRQLMKKELRKRGKGHDDYLDPQLYYLSPVANTYFNPVVVLTNRVCFSACNDFVFYMSSLPRVTVIGDRTGGGGAIPYNYVLSNGWKLFYSATATLDANNNPVEAGIDPDEFRTITPADENSGRDPIIDRAVELLQ